MASLSQINILFKADLKSFSSSINNANRQINKLGGQMQRSGAALSIGLTLPLVAFGKQALQTFAEVDSLRRGLTAVMGSADGAGEEFIKLREVAKLPGLGLEEAIKGSVNLQAAGFSADEARKSLLSFGNALATVGKGKAELDRVILALTQLNNKSTGFGQDLRQLTEQLPQLRGALLSAFGTQNSEEIAKLGITGRDVVTKLVTEFEKLPKVTGGIKNAFENISDTIKIALASIGEDIDKAVDVQGIIDRLAGFITTLVDGFRALSPETKKWIVILAGVAAAVGPLLAFAGVVLPAIGTGLALLTGPIGLVIAGLVAIGVAIYKNWAPIKKALFDIANYFIELYNQSFLFRVGVEAVINVFKNLFEIGKFVFETLKNIIGGFIDSFINGFKSIGKIIKAVFTGDLKALPGIVKEITTNSKNVFKGFTTELGADFKTLLDGVANNGKSALDAISNGKIKLLQTNVDASGVKDSVEAAVVAGITAGASGAAGGGGGRAQVNGLDLSGLSQGSTELTNTPLTGILAQMPAQVEAMNEQQFIALDNALTFTDSLNQVIQSGVGSFVDGFGDIIANFASGSGTLSSLGNLFLGTIANMATQLGKMAIGIGIGVGAIKKALQSLNPAVAIAAGIALVALGGIIKGGLNKISTGGNAPKFANGGIVGGSSFYGDKILARVNSGELILNEKQQQSLYGLVSDGGSGSTTTTTRQIIEGDKLILITERAQNKRNRRG